MIKDYWIEAGEAKMLDLLYWIPDHLFLNDILMDFSKKSMAEEIDLAVGDLSDAIKDRGIELWEKVLKSEKEITLPTEEVLSEVVDYLEKHAYKIMINDNKIKLV